MGNQVLNQMLQKLRCPVSKQPLVAHQQTLVSLDAATRLSYPTQDGIPVLLAEEAVKLDLEQWRSIVDAVKKQ
ncbi:MAG: hypothetical protein CMJ93_02445 [Planctomycetes bacterium]|nr:hypothetical protein [Planctomycetota bacterium]|tara:strand:- start:531 stop:749 length:219 start_codon:yes stop_codon:yes gene_type:complete